MDGFTTILGYVFIVVGFLSFIPQFVKSIIKANNTVQGVQTKITKGTMLYYQIVGIVLIIVGIAILANLFGFSSSTPSTPQFEWPK